MLSPRQRRSGRRAPDGLVPPHAGCRRSNRGTRSVHVGKPLAHLDVMILSNSRSSPPRARLARLPRFRRALGHRRKATSEMNADVPQGFHFSWMEKSAGLARTVISNGADRRKLPADARRHALRQRLSETEAICALAGARALRFSGSTCRSERLWLPGLSPGLPIRPARRCGRRCQFSHELERRVGSRQPAAGTRLMSFRRYCASMLSVC